MNANLHSTISTVRSRATWLFLALLAGAQSVTATESPATSAPATPSVSTSVSATQAFQRIVVIGASASAGFHKSELFGGPKSRQTRLSSYLNAAISPEHEPVQNLANAFFWLGAETEGRKQINKALHLQPSLLVGVDFLFWFCYGRRSDDERLLKLEAGLKLLDLVDCPLVVGDIPDASAAVPEMLRREDVPSAEMLLQANERLKQWASKHPNVVLLPLAKFMCAAMDNAAIQVRDHTFANGETAALLQSDKLHPTPLGTAVLALSALDALCSKHHKLSADVIQWHPQSLCALALTNLVAVPKSK
jgi:hypothetical protein